MSESESSYNQLLNQRNLEYTLYHVYRLKAENEKEPIIKVIYKKLSDDSLNHLALVENVLKLTQMKTRGGGIPKLTMMKIMGLDPSTMKKEEIAIDEVDTSIEEMETAAAIFFGAFADEFPDRRLSKFFNRMRDEEWEHQKLLMDIKEYRKMKP